MDATEYETYRDVELEPINPSISVADIDGEDRTLVFGYTLERNSFHAYKAEGQIHRVIFDHNANVLAYVHGVEVEAELLSPSKRAYPQYSDLPFALKMRQIGLDLPFTTWVDPEDRGPFAAKTAAQMGEFAGSATA